LTERYNDAVDHVADHESACERCYHSRLDLTRINRPGGPFCCAGCDTACSSYTTPVYANRWQAPADDILAGRAAREAAQKDDSAESKHDSTSQSESSLREPRPMPELPAYESSSVQRLNELPDEAIETTNPSGIEQMTHRHTLARPFPTTSGERLLPSVDARLPPLRASGFDWEF